MSKLLKLIIGLQALLFSLSLHAALITTNHDNHNYAGLGSSWAIPNISTPRHDVRQVYGPLGVIDPQTMLLLYRMHKMGGSPSEYQRAIGAETTDAVVAQNNSQLSLLSYMLGLAFLVFIINARKSSR